MQKSFILERSVEQRMNGTCAGGYGSIFRPNGIIY